MEYILCIILLLLCIFIRDISKLRSCNHDWDIEKRSNILQLDDMGYPLRLCICKCSKCKKYKQLWIDVAEDELDELKNDKSYLLKWDK